MEITITQGLAELKMLDKRITRKINNSIFAGYTVGGKVQTGYETTEELEKEIKANLESVKDLIKRRNKIKSLIVLSNAKTEVKIAGKTYTVAEAIDRKSFIDYEEGLLSALKSAYAHNTAIVDRKNNDMESRLDNHLETLFGKDGKTDTTKTAEVVKQFKEINEARLVDPVSLRKQIETLETEIEDFTSEVDHVLSVSNATTTIEIED